MKKFLSSIFILLLFSSLFIGCGDSSAEDESTLTILNYGKYFDPDALKMFEEEYGVTIKYEEYESPEEMYTKYKAGSIDYDLLCTSDYMIHKLIQEGEVLEINYDNIPEYQNIDSNIIASSASFDENHKYTVPYFYGTVGILYDTQKVAPEEVETWDVLWDKKYSNNIIMSNSVRDCFLVPLRRLGYSINTTEESKLREALDLLFEQKPHVYAYFVDETSDEMIAGNSILSVVYSGEAAVALDEAENLGYSVPKEGSNLWIDSWFIPKSCTNQPLAEEFLNFLCREDVAALNFDYVYYATPNTAVYNALDEETKGNTTIFPTQETRDNCEVYISLNKEETALYNDLWKELKSY